MAAPSKTIPLSNLEQAKATFKKASDQNDSSEVQLIQRMPSVTSNPIKWASELYSYIRGEDWRGYDNVVGQPCFYSGYTENLKTATLASPLLHAKLEELSEKRIKREVEENLLDRSRSSFATEEAKRKIEIRTQLEEITAQMLDNMMCKMESNTFVRVGSYSALQLLTQMYNGVHVNQAEVNRLLEVAAIAAEKKQPIIFLPRHSSHADYVSLQLVCYVLGLTLPVVVAGDNLNFPAVGAFLQHIGAMWIRRSFEGDQLYTTLVQSYLDTMFQKGYNMEWFIEGGRSRTGKLLGPKFGILSFLLDSVLSGRTEDAYICPVSMQYDKVLEVDSYVSELLGKPKKQENLADFISSSSALSLNLGRIDCRFHEPWSLRQFINEQSQRYNSGPESVDLSQTGPKSELRVRLLRTLGYRVLSDINSVHVVMPTALIGTVLLTLRGRGVGRTELARRVDWLCGRIRANGGNVADFHGLPTSEVCDRALSVLGPKLVGTIEGLAQETYYAVDRFQLSFYRNMSIHLFISEALISVALYTKVKRGGGSASEQILESELLEQVKFLSQLFRGEFIFSAGQGLERNLEDAMKGLIRDNVLEYRNIDGKRYIGLAPQERKAGREIFDFYCFLIWPFCDAAWLGAISLLAIIPPLNSSIKSVPISKAEDIAQLGGRTLYHQGDLSYYEAINKEALRNAYARFQEEGIIIQTKSKDKSVPATMHMSPEWLPARDPETGRVVPEGKLWEFVKRINVHRKQGKNRRDNATLKRRVLGLADILNKELFDDIGSRDKDDSSGDEQLVRTTSEGGTVTLKKKRRRRSKL